MNNPFSLSFGKEPSSFISRTVQEEDTINDLKSENPSNHVFMITGVRGFGKTVFMTKISKEISKDDSWIVIDAIPETNIVEYVIAKLQSNSFIKNLFKEMKISLSLPGIEISFGNQKNVIKNPAAAFEKIMEQIIKKGKKILICIDEVVTNQNIKEFISLFQVMLRKDANIFLIMTGLYENIYELQNEKTLTFLYRAPRIALNPLNQNRIAMNYKEIFKLSDEEAKKMSISTKGYPFAYQVLGYLCYKNNKPFSKILNDYDLYLEEYVYEKIWSELSNLDKKVLTEICKNEGLKNEKIRSSLKMTISTFNEYRTRLIRKGLITSNNYGYVSLSLPRFKEFVFRTI